MTPKQLTKCVQLILTMEGMSHRRMGDIVGVSHNTVKRYKKILEKKQITWDDARTMSHTQLEWLLEIRSQRGYRKRRPDFKEIILDLKRPDVTRLSKWMEHREQNPEDALSLSRFNELINETNDTLNVTMRRPHRAGECIFVDFCGRTVPWTNKDTGEQRQAQIFVGVLGCSNYTFVYAVESQSSPSWIEAHNRMFEFFGGASQLVVSDNLKAAVIKAGREPKINDIYFTQLQHYGSYPLPARPRRPRDKGKVEGAVRLVRRWILARMAGMTFFSIAEINAAIAGLLRWFNEEKKLKRLDVTRFQLYERLDKPALKLLPGQPFEHIEWMGSLKVAPDYRVYVDKHYYTVPYQLAHERVDVRLKARTVEIYFNGKCVVTHSRGYEVGGETPLKEHFPPNHLAILDESPDRFLAWAKPIGAAATAAVEYQFRDRKHVLISIQACKALLGLAKEHGNDRFEAACRRAQAIGSLTVKSIRSILQHKLFNLVEAEKPRQVGLPLNHPYVRGATAYATGGR